MDDRTDVLNFGDGSKELTWGKKYQVITFYPTHEDGRQYISIINDKGSYNDYLMSRFATIERFRELQLDRLEIDEA
jgi:hypothetical protein